MMITPFIRDILRKTMPFPVMEFLRRVYWRTIGRDHLSFFRETERHALQLAPFCGGPRVSILCSVWNTRPVLLRQMIRSVMTQSYQNWELVINNCSDPSHPEVDAILARYAAADSRITVYKMSNRGIALNTNAAADRASGEFIVLADHDDLLLPEALEHLVKAQCQKDADFVYADEYYYIMQYHVVWRKRKKPFSMKKLEEENYVNHPVLIRKTLFSQIGGFRSGFEGSQDHDLYLRLLEKTSKTAYVPEPLYVWRIHQNSFSQSSVQSCIDSGKRALEEHFRRIGLAAVVNNYKNETRYKVSFLKQKS